MTYPHVRLSRKLRTRREWVRPTKFASVAASPQAMANQADISQKKLVFTVTAGRTGTALVTNLFAILPNTTAVHEAAPSYTIALTAAQKNPLQATRFLEEEKLPAIAAAAGDVFVETSHILSKGFLESYLRLGFLPHLICLHRPLREIALSMLPRWWVPGKTAAGRKFSIWVDDPMTLPFPDWRKASDYQRCFWYAIEMERRMRHYAALYGRNGNADHIHAVSTKGITRIDTFIALTDRLGIDRGDEELFVQQFAEASAKKHNAATYKKPVIENIDAQEDAVWDRVGFYEPTLKAEIDEWFLSEPL